MSDNVATRYLLIELDFEGDDEPEVEGGPLDRAREAIEAALELQGTPFLGANVEQVYPGDVVSEEAGIDWPAYARDVLSDDPERLKAHLPEWMRGDA